MRAESLISPPPVYLKQTWEEFEHERIFFEAWQSCFDFYLVLLSLPVDIYLAPTSPPLPLRLSQLTRTGNPTRSSSYAQFYHHGPHVGVPAKGVSRRYAEPGK